MCLSRVLPASLSYRIRLRSCPVPLSSAVSEYIDRWRDTTSSSSRRSSAPLDKQVVSVRTPDYPRTPLSGGGARGCSCYSCGDGGNCYYSCCCCCCRWKLRMFPANACASAFGEKCRRNAVGTQKSPTIRAVLLSSPTGIVFAFAGDVFNGLH